MAEKYSYSEDITNKFIKLIEAGKALFQEKQQAGQLVLPVNPVSGVNFFGFNQLYLMTQNRPDPRWCTFNQCIAKGWQVKKGSKGVTLSLNKADQYFYFHVFNASDIAKIPALEQVKPEQNAGQEEQITARAEQIIRQLNPVITHNSKNAGYNPQTDTISIPPISSYESKLDYYADLFHQIAHWTGHETRLERSLQNPVNTPGHAKEELRAHIACLMLAAETGVPFNPHNIVEQRSNWADTLKKDSREIIFAANGANRIKEYMVQGADKFRESMKVWKQQQEAKQDKGYKPAARQMADLEIAF